MLTDLLPQYTPFEGACAGENPDAWTSDDEIDQAYAIAVCLGCPLQRACYRAGRDEKRGVWGGWTREMRGHDGTFAARTDVFMENRRPVPQERAVEAARFAYWSKDRPPLPRSVSRALRWYARRSVSP